MTHTLSNHGYRSTLTIGTMATVYLLAGKCHGAAHYPSFFRSTHANHARTLPQLHMYELAYELASSFHPARHGPLNSIAYQSTEEKGRPYTSLCIMALWVRFGCRPTTGVLFWGVCFDFFWGHVARISMPPAVGRPTERLRGSAANQSTTVRFRGAKSGG
jgi:hypothetical protein